MFAFSLHALEGALALEAAYLCANPCDVPIAGLPRRNL